MKFIFALVLLSLTLSSFASNLVNDLSSKDCAITMNKTISLSKKELGKDIGQLSVLSLYHNKKLSLKSGESYDVLDTTEGNIALNVNGNLVFLCITEGDLCIKDISKIMTKDIQKLSESALKMECR